MNEFEQKHFDEKWDNLFPDNSYGTFISINELKDIAMLFFAYGIICEGNRMAGRLDKIKSLVQGLDKSDRVQKEFMDMIFKIGDQNGF